METVRPVKRVDAAGSLRMSREFVGSIRSRDTNNPLLIQTSNTSQVNGSVGGGASGVDSRSPTKKSSRRLSTSEQAKAGRSIVDEVIIPILQKHTRDDMDAREIEALSMLARGFADLKETNPELSYNVVLDILSGINEFVHSFFLSLIPSFVTQYFSSIFRSNSVKQHIATTKGLFPHKRIVRKSEMTAKGLIVVEQEEDTTTPASSPTSPQPSNDSPVRKSPIAELLYMRWLEGLKIKWPNILGS